MLAAILRLSRPADWCKSLFVLPALLASGKAVDPVSAWAAVVAFAAFSFTASGVYCINDALDWREDARHPVKRRRPIPSGEVSPKFAWGAGLAWIALGFSACFAVETNDLWLVLTGYLFLQAMYNMVLKRVAMIDVVALSLGFVLRAMAGATAIGVTTSLWLLACVFFLCLYLGEIKRVCDLTSMKMNGGGEKGASGGWRHAAGYESTDELNWMLAVSAALAVGTFLLYAMTEHPTAAPGAKAGTQGFVLLAPVIVVAMYRFHRAARRGESDSPLRILASDGVVIACVVLFGAAAVTLLYVPAVSEHVARWFGT